MKKLTAIFVMICLLLSLSCAAVADGGVAATQAQYLSWETARRVILDSGLGGSLVQIGDYNLMMWMPDTMTELNELPGENYIAYYAAKEGAGEIGVQVIEMGKGFTLEAFEQQIAEQGYTDGGMFVINGFYGLAFSDEQTDNLSIAFVTGETEAICISFYPVSDEDFLKLVQLMVPSIQPAEPSLYNLADMIDTDLLETVWGDNRKVTFNEADNSIHIILWDDGLNSDNIKSVNNWEEMKNDKLALASFYQDSLKELGASDVHLILQYVADEDDGAFLTIVDGEVVYDVFA